MSSVLLDTNVLIYALDEDSQYYAKAQQLLFDSNLVLLTTSKNLSEFLAVVTRYPKPPLEIEAALNAIEEYSSFLTVLYPSQTSYAIFKNLLTKYEPTGLQIHDVEIASIALANSVNMIATFNRRDFENIEEIELIV